MTAVALVLISPAVFPSRKEGGVYAVAFRSVLIFPWGEEMERQRRG